MKQYVIDELTPDDHQALKKYLDANLHSPTVDGIYWLRLDADQYADLQNEHEACGPFYFALELEPERLTCEMLVRAEQRIRCDCIRYATVAQRNWLINVVETIFDRLDIHI